MIRLLSLLSVLMVFATAYGDRPKLDQSVRELVQTIDAPDSIKYAASNAVGIVVNTGRFTDHGSGVYLGDFYVATAAHVVAESNRGEVVFQDGVRRSFVVEQSDRKWDQALLRLNAEHPTLGGVNICDEKPSVGDVVYSVGRGKGYYRIFNGYVSGFSAPGQQDPSDWFTHSGVAVQGDSGGPVFERSGRLVGCLWGARQDGTRAVCPGRFQQLIQRVFPRITAWRQRRLVGVTGQCLPGQACDLQPSVTPSSTGTRTEYIAPTQAPVSQAPVLSQDLSAFALKEDIPETSSFVTIPMLDQMKAELLASDRAVQSQFLSFKNAASTSMTKIEGDQLGLNSEQKNIREMLREKAATVAKVGATTWLQAHGIPVAGGAIGIGMGVLGYFLRRRGGGGQVPFPITGQAQMATQLQPMLAPPVAPVTYTVPAQPSRLETVPRTRTETTRTVEETRQELHPNERMTTAA